MELLVVLLIIGVLSTVAIRTIDATRGRALFDQTSQEMKGLVQTIVGNTDLVVDGRRVDFGFYGDMGRMPEGLEELVDNTNGDTNWHGPYVRREFVGDSVGYLHDAWGNRYTYDSLTGTISSLGDGRHPLTVRIADTLTHLSANFVTGNVVDADNNPPGDAPISIWLYTSAGQQSFTQPDRGGYYEFTAVPIGIHRILAVYRGFDSLERWVTVTPRSNTVIDFRFSRPFRNFLKIVGQPELGPLPGDSTGFIISLVNLDIQEVTVDSVILVDISDSTAFLRKFFAAGQPPDSFIPHIGKGATIPVTPGATVPPLLSEPVQFGFFDFRTSPTSDTAKDIRGVRFRLRFIDDGSEITVTVPGP